MDSRVKIRSVEYIGGILDPGKIKKLPDLPMIIFAGRSNVGKSSLLNMVLSRKVAHVGKSPGKTKLLNFFLINNALIFVDLPGYGYAKVSKDLQEKWERVLSYFLHHPNIAGAIVLIDIRHPPMKNDRELIELLLSIPVNFRVVLTKSDKLSRNQQLKMQRIIAKEILVPPSELIISSSAKKIGRDEIWNAIFTFLDRDTRKEILYELN